MDDALHKQMHLGVIGFSARWVLATHTDLEILPGFTWQVKLMEAADGWGQNTLPGVGAALSLCFHQLVWGLCVVLSTCVCFVLGEPLLPLLGLVHQHVWLLLLFKEQSPLNQRLLGVVQKYVVCAGVCRTAQPPVLHVHADDSKFCLVVFSMQALDSGKSDEICNCSNTFNQEEQWLSF